MKEKKDIPSKPDGLGTFGGEQTEIGTFSQLFVFRPMTYMHIKYQISLPFVSISDSLICQYIAIYLN